MDLVWLLFFYSTSLLYIRIRTERGKRDGEDQKMKLLLCSVCIKDLKGQVLTVSQNRG